MLMCMILVFLVFFFSSLQSASVLSFCYLYRRAVLLLAGVALMCFFLAFVLLRFSACAILHRVLPVLYIM